MIVSFLLEFLKKHFRFIMIFKQIVKIGKNEKVIKGKRENKKSPKQKEERK